jgi:hypothetical protein
MSDNRRNFIFRTPNLLVKPFNKQGSPCYDSQIQILARTRGEACYKLNGYIELGKKMGWYK